MTATNAHKSDYQPRRADAPSFRRVRRGGVWGPWHAETEPFGQTWCGLLLRGLDDDQGYDQPADLCPKCERALEDGVPRSRRIR